MVTSIDRVEDELQRGGETGKKDALALWAHEHSGDLFSTTDDAGVIACYAEVMAWAAGQPQYLDAAKEDFASGADGWVIAFAKAKGCTVVTLEASSPQSRSRRGVRVPFADTFAMLRELSIKLH